jgi:hypothetical protein
MFEAWPEYVRKSLVANGTFNPDGSINMETAQRLGWTRTWEEAVRARRLPESSGSTQGIR